MHYEFPKYVWAEFAPAIFLAGWAVAEWQRRRRLKAFGDPGVLGVASSWLPRTTALVLLLAGVSAAAAILPVPVRGVATDKPAEPEIQILVHLSSIDSAGDRVWEALETAIQDSVASAPAVRFGMLAPGAPPEVLVPSTLDAKGLQIMVSRLRFEPMRGSRADLAATLAEYSDPRSSRIAPARLVVITAMAEEEIERLPMAAPGSRAEIGFIRLPHDGAPAQFGYREPRGTWRWTVRPPGLGGLKQSIQTQGPAGGLSLVQWFALLSFALLSGEYLCAMMTRSDAAGDPNA